MAAIKKYFQKQFQLSMFNLEHEDWSDFYLSAFQGSRSPLPLLCLRSILFLGCVALLIACIVLTVQVMPFGLWLAFLTHWGVILITITSGCATLVSLKAFLEEPFEPSSSLVVLAKTCWVFYNTTVPIAFTITVFYWAFLTQTDQDFAVNAVLDVFIHAVNSVVMLVLLLISRIPSRLLHFYQPLTLGLIYLLFTIIYYFAGGSGPFGDGAIYPMLNWARPGEAMVTAVGTAVLLTVSHITVVLLSLGRDKLGKRLFENDSVNIYSN